MVTNNLLKEEPPQLAGWMEWISSAKQTESGEISFRYTQLSPLKNEVQPEPFPTLQLAKKKKVLTLTNEYEVAIIPLFHATGNFSYRSSWQEGVLEMEEFTHLLPRLGMRSRCVFENGETIIYASSYSFSTDHIEFSDTDEETNYTTYYTLDTIVPGRTKLTVDIYIPNKIFAETVFKLQKKNSLEKVWRQSLKNLTHFVKEIQLPEEVG
ncbi:MAG: hypothetical protein EOO98_05450 [Pedobacter sp.]|nr:MAG: hypothetical protein EOO98_05450 [Pedobacter sp.]